MRYCRVTGNKVLEEILGGSFRALDDVALSLNYMYFH
jgi:hypothetical protein